MRISILIGLILVVLGAATLYQTRNGFFMYMLGHVTHWPPEGAEAIGAEFAALAREPSETPGVRLGDVAKARADCAAERLGSAAPSPAARVAFERLNLILLGVGVNSPSAVIPPDARRLTELRGDLTRDARQWRPPALNAAAEAQFERVIDDLSDAESQVYAGVDLIADFADLDFSRYVEVLIAGGEDFHACVASRRI